MDVAKPAITIIVSEAREAERLTKAQRLANTAHAIRAILLASATATTLVGRRPQQFDHPGILVGRARAQFMTDVAPTTSSRRR
jgi:hypothetical protein